MKNNLKTTREDLGLTQEQVARTAGINGRYYQDLEAGRSVPGVKHATNIARALKTTIEALWPIGK